MFNLLKVTEMKKLFYYLVALAMVLSVVNCGGKSVNSPAGIEKSIYTQLHKGDYKKAAELLVDNLVSGKEETPEEKVQFVKIFEQKAKQSVEAKGGIKSFEVEKEEIAADGLSAIVSTKILFNDGSEKTETTKYVKKDNAWKISMNK